MRLLLSLVAILTILIGALIFSYHHINESTKQTITQISPAGVNTVIQKIIYLPPALGVAMLLAGIAVLILSRRK